MLFIINVTSTTFPVLLHPNRKLRNSLLILRSNDMALCNTCIAAAKSTVTMRYSLGSLANNRAVGSCAVRVGQLLESSARRQARYVSLRLPHQGGRRFRCRLVEHGRRHCRHVHGSDRRYPYGGRVVLKIVVDFYDY